MFRLIAVTVLFLAQAMAAVVTLDRTEDSVNIVPQSRYLIENTEHYTPQSILQTFERFQPAEGDIYNFGFVEKPIWILFSLRFPLLSTAERILRIDNPHIDEYRFYRIEGGDALLLGSGGDLAACEEQPQCRTFWEPLTPVRGEATYLLWLHTKGSLQVPLTVETLPHAYHDEAAMNLMFGFYYGVVALLLLYNMVLYIVVKEVQYLNYLVFLGSYTLFQLSFDGVGREWIWPDNTWMSNGGLAFFIFLSALFGFRFARSFLMLKRYALQTDRVLFGAEVFSFVGVLVALFLDYHTAISLAAFWSAIVPWLLIYAGIQVLPHYHAARYYLVGWTVFLLGTILVALNKLGMVPIHPAMLYAQQVGSLLQMILLSFALADRINMMKIEHMEKLREFNEELQVRIGKKVDELRQKDRMMIQQSRQAAMGEMIENIAHQWRQPLNQLSLIQSNIFFEFELGTLGKNKMREYQDQAEALMEYMTHTIDDFRNFFLPDRASAPFCICSCIERVLELIKPTLTRYKIDVQLSCEGRPTAVGHENEFSQVMINLLNNAKDAMAEHHTRLPRIQIRVIQEAGKTNVIVCDNGGGVDPVILDRIFDPYFTTKFRSQGTGIGLYMVKMIMEKSMQGEVYVDNRRDGACFTLELPLEAADEA